MKYSANVDKLLSYGVFNYNKDWSNYLTLGFTSDDVPALLQLALDEELLQNEGDIISAAPFHAWRLLGLLKAEVAILPLIDAMADDDWSTEEACDILGLIGEKAIEPIKHCLTNPVINEDKKRILTEALGKIIKGNPECREQAVAFFTEYLANITEKDSSLAGLIVLELIDMDAKESIETIREAFQRDCVDIFVIGDVEDVEIDMGFRRCRTTQRSGYFWQRDNTNVDDILEGLHNFTNAKIVTKSEQGTKVGRNEPCPCGSGKKYKKCCLH